MPFTRREFCASLATAAALSAQQQQRRPNVVILLTDDQGYGDLGCHGNPVLKTPNLDALYGRSVRFTNFHVSPTCAPTRSALMTGRYTNATGAWHTIMGRSLLAPGEVTMAECFKASGYRTGIFGKWHLGDNYPCRPQDRGFDEVLVNGGGGVWQAPDYFGNDYQDDTYFHNGKPEPQKGYCTQVWFDAAMSFMQGATRSDQPFFCYLATNAPHGPMWAPPGAEDLYRNVKGLSEPGFYGMIADIDRNVGRLMEFLQKEKLEEDTILLYLSDNGTSSGSEVFNAGMRDKKGSPYDGGHRVPWLLRWPRAGLNAGRDIDALTAHIDVLPTLMDYCGLTRPQGPPLHGRSLRPLLAEDSPNWPERVLVTDSQRMDHLVKWKHAAVMTSQWRLVSPTANGDESRLELYDVRSDPGQRRNLADSNPNVVKKLKTNYEDWWKETSQRADEVVRIILGDSHARSVKLSSHDWHGQGAERAWNQRQIREAPAVNGTWAVEVAESGKYQIELRRWPREIDLPVNAAYHDPKPNREKTSGKAIHAKSARITIGDIDLSSDVGDGVKAVVFEAVLKKGPAELQTWFYSADGTERGAYYAYVEKL